MRKRNIQSKGFSLFTKIFLMFILFTLPLYLLSIQIITSGKEDIRKEMLESSNSNAILYLNTLEHEFMNIIRLQTGFMSNINIAKLSKSQGFDGLYDTARSVISIQAELQQIKEASRYVDNAVVLLPSLDLQITNESIGAINGNQLEYYTNLVKQNTFPFTYDAGRIYILLSPFYQSSNLQELAKPAYIICVEISRDRMVDSLSTYFNLTDGGAVFIGDRYGLSVWNDQDSPVIPELHSLIEREGATYQIKTRVITVDNKKYSVSFIKSMTINACLVVYQLEEQLANNLRSYQIWLWIMTLLMTGIVILFSVWIRNMIVNPLNRLISAYDSLDEGNLDLSVDYSSNDEFGYLYKKFNELSKKYSMLVRQVYEEKLNTRNAELKQLQFQINPHFLYNCFFLINRLARMDDIDNVISLSQHLGKYYQFITKSSSDQIPLCKEMEHVRSYIEIQNLRFSNRITATIKELPPEYENIMVPKLILQPIVENAYLHGLRNTMKGGIILIESYGDSDFFVLAVEDSGTNINHAVLSAIREKLQTEDPNVEYSGLINVHRRLRLKFGEESGIRVQQGDLGGLRVEMVIQLSQDNLRG